ncbi:thermonuclease family protein [Geobacillus stearothermophilus]|uniref:thermonuclease family protein n=1 Tax=Geobacillus stearothermophilus TaxID=1422 RepID=UPI000A488F69|nr:thermonuclease family protein [Geobacillus stearothermophilus]MED3723858.1 thermonuclease family protein [Geobacillus stearothermophilus]MED3770683.1 thermonuclease family protein [Geobacillus stearothermophilus]MED3773234.1 thermonuclease family protein [Geobacillus stearothermophilus]
MRKFLTIALSFVMLFGLVTPTFAHPGALDELGGHFRRADCTYLLHHPTSLARKAKNMQELIALIKKYNSNSKCTRGLTPSKVNLEGFTFSHSQSHTPSTHTKPATKPTTKKVALPSIKINSKHTVKVIRVVDGDTVEVRFSNGATAKVRLIGVNTPETVHPNKPVEKYGKEASNYTKKRLTNKTVTLEFDVQIKDKYGRLLAYVWIGKELYNETLVKEGYANVMTIPPNVKYQKRFVTAERAARQAKKGLWK